MVLEMIYIVSLVYDDVIDGVDIRRGKIFVNKMFGERMLVLVVDYIFVCVF